MTDMHREALLTERQRFEQWYLTQGKYSFDPIGGRDCSMQWEAWQAAIRREVTKCRGCGGVGWYTSHTTGYPHRVPCKYCNKEGKSALRYRDEQEQTSVWRCYKEYMSGDGGRVHSEKFAKTKADMLIFKSQGYDCEKLSDEQEKQA